MTPGRAGLTQPKLLPEPCAMVGPLSACSVPPGCLAAHHPRLAESGYTLPVRPCPGVGARVAPGGDLGQPAEVMGPAFGMGGALLGIGEARVGHAQQGSVGLLDQIDLDQARPRRHHLAAVEAPAVSEAVHRHHLAERAAGETSSGDIDEIEPAGLRLDLRLCSHPAQDLLRICQEREHRGGWRRDVLLAPDDKGLLHRSLRWSLWLAPPAWLSPYRTRRGATTRRRSRCAPWARGRATGTCPTGRPVR